MLDEILLQNRLIKGLVNIYLPGIANLKYYYMAYTSSNKESTKEYKELAILKKKFLRNLSNLNFSVILKSREFIDRIRMNCR